MNFKFKWDNHFGFTLEKLVLIMGFALLSFFIVMISGFSYDVKFMTVFGRSIKAFFTAGFAAFVAVGVLSILEKYYEIKAKNAASEQTQPPPPESNNQ